MLKLSDADKRIMEEISTISEINKDVIREVWENTIYFWVTQIMQNPKELVNLTIPMFGNIGLKYIKDIDNGDNTTSADIQVFTVLNDSIKVLIGDFIDENYNALDTFLKKKIDMSIINSIEDD